METTNFLFWLVFIAAVAGGGLAAMIWAYRGSGSVTQVFEVPIAVPPGLENANAASQFQQGVEAFQAGNYRQSVDCFTRVIQHLPDLAEAYHNRGLAIANLRQINEAVSNLVQAAELYLQQDQQAAAQQVKQNLELLKAKRQAETKN
jgi:tetratricopeptide (TPR) repeat protein